MASRFEIVEEEYIEELKDRSENENKTSTEWWKNVNKKWANERSLKANLEEYENDRSPPPSILAVLSIQKFSNFALCVIKK